MSKKLFTTENNFGFYFDESIQKFDDYELWRELVVMSLQLIAIKITDEHKDRFRNWTISHRQYNSRNPLDYNYVLFESGSGSFEVYRNRNNGIFSKPKIKIINT